MTLPWRSDTTEDIAAEVDSRYETPGGAQNKVNVSQEYLLNLLKLAVTGLSNGAEAAIARHSDPYNITYDWLKDRLDAADQREINQGENNVKNFGAKGDGTTDDRAAIQNAINAAAFNGRDVIFPPGTYLVGGSLIMPTNTTGIRLRGCGLRSQLLLNFAGHMITFASIPTGLALIHHDISDLCLMGNGKNSGDLIRLEYVSCIVIERCFFMGLTKTGNGIYVGGNPNNGESSHDIIIRDNYFDSYNLQGNSAIYLDEAAADLQISRNIMELRFSVDYGLYINNCGSLQSFDNHYYNCKTNTLKINGANGKHYNFDNDFIDNANMDVVNIDGTTTEVSNGSISFNGCLFMRPGSGYSYICLVNNVYNVSIIDCTFPTPSAGARSAIRAINSVNVNDILIERNTFTNPGGYSNGVIENIYGFRCVIQNNAGYKKNVTGVSWFSLNAWVEFPEQSSGLLYLGLYTTDASDGAIIVHYREGSGGTDFSIFTGKVAGAADTSNPLLVPIPVSPNANIRIDTAGNVAIQSKIFVPFNV